MNEKLALQAAPASGVTTAPSAGFAVWLGFGAMCLGMFMAILDIQVVVTSLPTIQAALDVDKDLISWVQTAYLIAEVIAIPLTGFLTRALTMRGLFVIALGAVYARVCGLRLQHRLRACWSVRHVIVQGFAGGMLIPLVFSAVFLAVSGTPTGPCHDDRRRPRGAGAHRWPGGRWLDHGNL